MAIDALPAPYFDHLPGRDAMQMPLKSQLHGCAHGYPCFYHGFATSLPVHREPLLARPASSRSHSSAVMATPTLLEAISAHYHRGSGKFMAYIRVKISDLWEWRLKTQ